MTYAYISLKQARGCLTCIELGQVISITFSRKNQTQFKNRAGSATEIEFPEISGDLLSLHLGSLLTPLFLSARLLKSQKQTETT